MNSEKISSIVLAVLVAIALVTITVAVIIKEKLDKQSHYFEQKLEESGLF